MTKRISPRVQILTTKAELDPVGIPTDFKVRLRKMAQDLTLFPILARQGFDLEIVSQPEEFTYHIDYRSDFAKGYGAALLEIILDLNVITDITNAACEITAVLYDDKQNKPIRQASDTAMIDLTNIEQELQNSILDVLRNLFTNG